MTGHEILISSVPFEWHFVETETSSEVQDNHWTSNNRHVQQGKLNEKYYCVITLQM